MYLGSGNWGQYGDDHRCNPEKRGFLGHGTKTTSSRSCSSTKTYIFFSDSMDDTIPPTTQTIRHWESLRFSENVVLPPLFGRSPCGSQDARPRTPSCRRDRPGLGRGNGPTAGWQLSGSPWGKNITFQRKPITFYGDIFCCHVCFRLQCCIP